MHHLIRTASGVTYDSETKKIVCSDEVWEEWIKVRLLDASLDTSANHILNRRTATSQSFETYHFLCMKTSRS
jgi:hypothetical protein